MGTAIDDHGQPFNLPFNAARRTERDISQLLGIAQGMIVDGIVSDEEARFLREWGTRHPDALVHWPVNVLFQRLERFYADGRIDDEERQDLQTMLTAIAGGNELTLANFDGTTTLPLDQPPPLICWDRETFVFTGRFAYGTRSQCQREVLSRGGQCADNVTRATSFLVIGTFSSRDWVHSTFGRKIQHAVKLRSSGFALRIVGEDHWARALSMANNVQR